MKIWHISDTHTNHEQLIVPENIDLIIHSGDATNYRDPIRNEPEMHKFLKWFAALTIRHKVFVAGNHDTSIEHGLIRPEYIEGYGINYLYNNSVTIEGLKIWGSPFTPTFGDWAFMKRHSKIGMVWDLIPDDANIVITHGPPKGVLDLTINHQNKLEMCGCSALNHRIQQIKPKLMCFGHIHNYGNGKYVLNSGTKKVAGLNTIFSNGACSTDRKWGVITSHGNIIGNI